MEAMINPTVELEDYGIMTDEWKEGTPTYNLRALFAFCDKTGKKVDDLTEAEREQFRTN